MADLDRLAAEARANEVRTEHGQDALPVDVLAIAAAKRISVESRPLECAGALIRCADDSFVICYSDRLGNEGFERFTIAHELGHFFLDGHVLQILPDSGVHESRSGVFDQNSRIERQADCFAAALLMPEDLVRRLLSEQRSPGFPQIQLLAAACKASITAAAIRYAEFADDPVAVVLSKGRNVQSTFLSQALRSAGVRPLRRGTPLPEASTTFTFNRNSSGCADSHVEGASALDHWFDNAPGIEVSEDVVGLGTYGLTLTVLFTEEALDDPDDSVEGDE